MASLARLRHGPIVARHLSTLSSWGFPCESKPGVGQPSADSRSCFGSKAQARKALSFWKWLSMCLSECGGNALVFTVGAVV